MSLNSFNARKTIKVDNVTYDFFSLTGSELNQYGTVTTLPISLKVLLENLLRNEDGASVTEENIIELARWGGKSNGAEIAFRPARVLMQDFTGVPAIVDLAAMRDAVAKLGYDPKLVNPISPVDLVIDHSVMVDSFGNSESAKENVRFEMQRNEERYQFLKWGQHAFDNFSVVPPGTGICHQVNLEYLAKVVWVKKTASNPLAYPDTLVGTDSHTTMINGLGVLGWGVGGIEAEAAMLGQPLSMLLPEVIGFKLIGTTNEGITATDLVLRIAQMLREKGVVGKFIEFYGDGLDALPLADRATIGNMSPEYGATCAYFPIDDATIDYLKQTNRDNHTIKLVEAYAKAQGLWRQSNEDIVYSDYIELDLSTIVASLAGPKRPQDRVSLDSVTNSVSSLFEELNIDADKKVVVDGSDFSLTHGDVVIAAITSCTNTSNPAVMMGAGILARNANNKGLSSKPWVKTSLAPGSKVVTEYLKISGLQEELDHLGFNLVGYGCTTCIGNSGPLPSAISSAVSKGALHVSSVLSGNRNFEGRVHQEVKSNWLASPLLVVAYALAGSTRVDLLTEPLGKDKAGSDVYLKDIWPSNAEISDAMSLITSEMFRDQYSNIFSGPKEWQALQAPSTPVYNWAKSSYIKKPPFFVDSEGYDNKLPIRNASILAVFGNSVTTDHISPAGQIQADSPAGVYLNSANIREQDFNSYGSRRGNHEVMMRGTFANIRIKNKMVPGVEGGFTKHPESADAISIFDAAILYQEADTPLVIFAGKEYGTGSSRDWAAKGTALLGVKAVIAESFERIHRSNLIGMGVIPLQINNDDILDVDGSESIDILLPNGADQLIPGQSITLAISHPEKPQQTTSLISRIDTDTEIEYFQKGGILRHVMSDLIDH